MVATACYYPANNNSKKGKTAMKKNRVGKIIFSLSMVWFCSLVLAACQPGSELNNQYEPPRMPNGKPDLQGFWTNSSVTDLERPDHLDKLILTEEEAQQFIQADPLANRLIDDAKPTDPNAPALDGSDLLAGRGYNTFWIDPGTQVGKVKGTYRSSWIVDPETGKIPFSDQGENIRKRSAELRNNFDGPEVRPLGERCMATTGRTGPPMLNGLYNNNYQFIQTDTHVVLLNEMVTHARIVKLNGSHPPTIVKKQFGDAIGWWDGDTLVVETSNFHPMHADYAHPAFLTESATVTERFTRWSDTEIFYEFVVDDPSVYSQAWRGEARFVASDQPLFEFACHEGNLSLVGILKGARVQEAEIESEADAR